MTPIAEGIIIGVGTIAGGGGLTFLSATVIRLRHIGPVAFQGQLAIDFKLE